MQLKYEGKMDILQLIPNINEVVNKVFEEAEIPKNSKFLIEDLNLKVVIVTNDGDLYATVPREVNGETLTEMLTCVLKLGPDGKIIKDINNVDESFYDNGTINKALGTDYEYSTIESNYTDDELEIVDSYEVGTDEEAVRCVVYKILKEDRALVRYYKGDTLVVETVMLPEFLPEYLSKKK